MKRLLLALSLALVLTGCSANEPGPALTTMPTATASAMPTTSESATTVAPAPAETSSAPATAATANSIPSPNPDQEAMLVASLNEIDPALVGDDGVVNHSRDQCSSILGGVPPEGLISSTKSRFETATFAPTDEQATEILDAIRSSGFCFTP